MLRLLGASVGGLVLGVVLATSALAQPKPIYLGGTPARPVRVTFAGTIGGAKIRGVPKATPGKASCTYRTTIAAKGLTLRGAVSFTARGERYVRRFAVRLR